MQVAPVACGDRSQCSPALSAAVTLIPGVVFSGGVSGFLRAYATDDARLLWEIDTARDYITVNGDTAHGGAMDETRPDRRQWHAVRQFRLRAMGWPAWERSVGLRGQQSLRSVVLTLGTSQRVLLWLVRHLVAASRDVAFAKKRTAQPELGKKDIGSCRQSLIR